jgi:hypothetical protein
MPLGQDSKRQLAVRSQTNKPNHLTALELINQHQIREDVTVAISLPVGSELMVAKPDWERLIGQKMPDHLFHTSIQLRALDTFEILFIVFFELC